MLKRFIKWLIQWVLIIAIILFGIVIIRTITFSSRQLPVPPVSKIQITDSVVQRLSDAISCRTISSPQTADTLEFYKLFHFLDSHFVLVDSFLDKDTINGLSLTYKWPGKNPRLTPMLLAAHSDVVPVEEASISSWTVPPFSGDTLDGHIWGRGALDDKVAIMAILESIEKLLADGYYPERSLYLAIGHDEESGGIQGAKAIATHFEKEGLQFEYLLDEGLIQLENALPGLQKPVNLVGIAEKGYLTLTLSVKLEKGGHSAMPPRETVIGILAKSLGRLEDHPFPSRIDGAMEQFMDYTGPEMGFVYKMVFANRWLFKTFIIRQLESSPITDATIRTSTAPTIIRGGIRDNVLPTMASAKVNFRILPGETIESVTEYVKEIVNDDRVIVSVNDVAFYSEPSLVSSSESFGFNVLRKTAHEVFPNTLVAPSLVIVSSDSRHYQQVTDQIFRYLPVRLTRDDLKRVHGIDERIGIEDYKNAIRFYYRLIQNSCK